MSRERRFFAENVDGDEVVLDEDESHHLRQVLRLSAGAEVSVFDGAGHARSAVVASTRGRRARLRLGERLSTRESTLRLTVAMSPPRAPALRLAIEKLTELGVHAIQPLVTDHGEWTESGLRARLDRLRQVALSACKQCGRATAPIFHEPRRLPELLERPEGPVLMLVPGAPPLAPEAARGPERTLVVGPAGGWSPDELACAEARGVLTCGLGPRTLRTETAAIVAAGILQWHAGDLGR